VNTFLFIEIANDLAYGKRKFRVACGVASRP